jgi:hypothetical protein
MIYQSGGMRSRRGYTSGHCQEVLFAWRPIREEVTFSHDFRSHSWLRLRSAYWATFDGCWLRKYHSSLFLSNPFTVCYIIGNKRVCSLHGIVRIINL